MVTRRMFPILEVGQEEKNRLSKVNRTLDDLFSQSKVSEAEEMKKESIKRVTLLYGSWVCNFECPKYCYTKETGNGVLSVDQAIEVIEQARGLGAQVTYWPGEGELTLLKDFWNIMDYQTNEGLPAVLFTNGSIFHDDKIAQGVIGKSSSGLVKGLNRNYPDLHFYVKYWSSNQHKAADMVGVTANSYPYVEREGVDMPLSLSNLLDNVDRERIGVEIMASRENYEDVVDNLLPAAEKLGIFAYVEPVIFSGNANSRQQELSLTSEQHSSLKDVFASGGTYCEKRQSTELIVKGTMLTPGIAIPPRQENSILDGQGRVQDVFEIFHNEYFRDMRKVSEENGGCLCRKYLDEGGGKQLVQL